MTPAAPISHVATPPSPADSGETLTVSKDAGEKFAQIAFPWDAIIFPQDTVPDFGENAERVTVHARDGDEFTIERAADPVEIGSGMVFALISDMVQYDAGDTVTMRYDFGTNKSPYTLTLAEPGGGTVVYTNGDITQDVGNGSALREDAFDKPGRYVYRFVGDGAHGPDTDFYVRPTEV